VTEIERGLRGERSEALDLYWMARHGHTSQVPPEAWPSILTIRHAVEGTYLPAESMIGLILKLGDSDGA